MSYHGYGEILVFVVDRQRQMKPEISPDKWEQGVNMVSLEHNLVLLVRRKSCLSPYPYSRVEQGLQLKLALCKWGIKVDDGC